MSTRREALFDADAKHGWPYLEDGDSKRMFEMHGVHVDLSFVVTIQRTRADVMRLHIHPVQTIGRVI